MEYNILIHKKNELFFIENNEIEDNDFLIIRMSKCNFNILDYLKIEEFDADILKRYLLMEAVTGSRYKIINCLICDSFTNASIKLAINLIILNNLCIV